MSPSLPPRAPTPRSPLAPTPLPPQPLSWGECRLLFACGILTASWARQSLLPSSRLSAPIRASPSPSLGWSHHSPHLILMGPPANHGGNSYFREWTKRPCLVAPRSTHPTDCLPVPVTVSLSQSNHRESRECEQASITNTNTGRQRPSCLCGGGVSRDPALPVLWWGMCFKLPGKR